MASKKFTPEEKKEQVIRVLRTIYDPEIPFNIYDLGLIYDVLIDDADNVTIVMTLTTPMCPVADSLPGEIATKVKGYISWVATAKSELVWEPPWDVSKMSEEARMFLGF